MQTTAELLAAFAAKGGKVSKVATGANSGISNRAFYLASQGNINLKRDAGREEVVAENAFQRAIEENGFYKS